MVVVFDLDDTLFPEMDYVESAYREIARRYGRTLLDAMMAAPSPREAFESTGIPIDTVLDIYRSHCPDIRLPWDSLYTLALLKNAGHKLGLVTDGRSITQRHKIESLELGRFMSDEMVYISGETGEEKTGGSAFRSIMERYPAEKYVYVGDNPRKDIEVPRQLGWTPVILLSKGRNVHSQNLSGVNVTAIRSLVELDDVIRDLSQGSHISS